VGFEPATPPLFCGWRRLNDTPGLQLLQRGVQGLIEQGVDSSIIHPGRELILAESPLIPGRKISKALDRVFFMPLNLHKTAALEVEMYHSKALSVSQNQTHSLVLRADRRNISRQSRQLIAMLHTFLPVHCRFDGSGG
jgi:hypothetical protein